MKLFNFNLRPVLVVCAALIMPGSSLLAKRLLVNKIIARVNGNNILLSAAQEPHLEKGGAPYTFEELINEELLCQKAAAVKREATNSDVDHAISSFKIQNHLTGLTDEEFDKMLKENGFTLPMLRRHHSRSMSAWAVRGMEVDNKIVITSQEVEDYWKKNPEYSKEEFHLQLAILDNKTKTMSSEQLKEKAPWKDLGWFERHEISNTYAVALDLAKGSISDPIDINGDRHILMLVEKNERSLKTLDQRYIEIERKLHEEKHKILAVAFAEELLKKASITYF